MTFVFKDREYARKQPTLSFYRDCKYLMQLFEKSLGEEYAQAKEVFRELQLIMQDSGLELSLVSDTGYLQKFVESLSDEQRQDFDRMVDLTVQIATMRNEHKEYFLLSQSKIRNEQGEYEKKYNMQIMFEAYLEDADKISYDVQSDDELDELMTFSNEVAEDFFFYMENKRKSYPNSSSNSSTIQ